MDGLIPTALAIGSAVQCVASCGGVWFGQGNNTTAFTALAAAGHPVPPVAIDDALADAYNAPHDTMYAQCMYARDYRVPGFSPSPDSSGYQGELPGPAAHNGGA